MMRTALAMAATLLTLGILPGRAMESGRYEGIADGGEIEVTVQGKRFSIGVGAEGCAGEGAGTIRKVASGRWEATLRDGENICKLDIQKQGKSRYNIEEGFCSYFHGTACSFSGFVTRR